MANILVAGAGHGGIVAAMKLQLSGHSVTLLEGQPEESIGLAQYDALDEASMQFAGIPVLPQFYAKKNRLTFVPLSPEVPPVTLPAREDSGALTVDRKEFLHYLLSLAAEAGVRILYATPVLSPIVLGSRVAGLHTEKQDFYADLIIDACGIHSPVRRGLPDFMHIQRDFPLYDTLYTYRAYFARVPEAPAPATDYNIYVRHDGTVGFCWLVTEEHDVDVLIARFAPVRDEEILEELRVLHEENPHMGTTLLRGGERSCIPVRQPLAVFVADGYAAVGNSAAMTYPVKGSGLGYALRAGTLLAHAVGEDKEGLFTAETLWEYERLFYKEIGFDACRLAVLKALLPYVTAREVSDLMGEKLLTTEELEKLTSDTLSTLLNAHGIASVREKIKRLNGHPESKKKLLNIPLWLGKLTVLEPFFPNKYDRSDVAKWAERCNELFESFAYRAPAVPTLPDDFGRATLRGEAEQ